MRSDHGAQLAHAHALLGLGHGDCAPHHGGGAGDVVRVDDQRRLQLGSRTRELAQHQHAQLVGARGHVLLGNQVHAVAQRRHYHCVGGAVQRQQVVRAHAPVQQLDGAARGRAVLGIDATHQLVHVATQLAVGVDLLARRHGQLDEVHLAAQRRLALQHSVEGQQPTRHALRVVEPVDAQQRLLAGCTGAQLLDQPVDLVRLALERLDLDADRIDAHLHVAVAIAHRVDAQVDAQHLGGRVDEVVAVRLGVKADQVGAQQAGQDLLTCRQDTEHVGGGPGNVQEEADARARHTLAQVAGHQHQLVVVDPDRVVRAQLAGDGLGEALVDRLVGAPFVARIQPDFVEQVVKQRPEHRVGVAVVIERDLTARQRHRQQALGGQLLLELLAAPLGHPAQVAHPADPAAVVLAAHVLQGRRQATTRGEQRWTVRPRSERHRQPVGDQDDSSSAHNPKCLSILGPLAPCTHLRGDGRARCAVADRDQLGHDRDEARPVDALARAHQVLVREPALQLDRLTREAQQ